MRLAAISNAQRWEGITLIPSDHSKALQTRPFPLLCTSYLSSFLVQLICTCVVTLRLQGFRNLLRNVTRIVRRKVPSNLFLDRISYSKHVCTHCGRSTRHRLDQNSGLTFD